MSFPPPNRRAVRDIPIVIGGGGERKTLRLVAEAKGSSADSLLDEADTLAGLGITMLTVWVNGPDYDLPKAEELGRWRDQRRTGS